MSSVVGIDFGYQNSVIAAAGRGGVDVILNGNSNRLNPSMVGYDECRRVGEHATSGISSNYKNTITGMKRLVGLAFDDPRAQAEMKRSLGVQFIPFPHATGGPPSVGVKVQFGGDELVLPLEAVAGTMIKHMGYIAAQKAKADTSAGNTDNPTIAATSLDQMFPQDWVVAIPNYYTDAQRRALLKGCEIAGIAGVQRLMHENTATALAYGIFKDLKKVFVKDKPTHVMFIDMGASAYTVSIAAFEPGKLIVKSAFCDPNLGGRDFDWVIAEWIAESFMEKVKGKLSAGNPIDKPKARIKLLSAAEKAKKTLSPQGVKEAPLNLEMLQDDFDFHTSLKADQYEILCAPLLARLEGPVKAALAEAKLTGPSDLDSVELVGGSTRIGCVKRRLMEILGGMTLSTTMNADESVARGAALQSAILSPRFKVLPYEIQEAQPYPIQLKWGDDAAAPTPENSVIMFDRGLSYPIVRRVTLKRSGTFEVSALYDGSSHQYGAGVIPGEAIAKFVINAPSGDEKKVRVNVKEDIHGILTLSSAQMVEEVEDDSPAEIPSGGEDKTTATGEGGDAGASEEKKKKIKKTNLDFSIIRPLDWSDTEVNKANEMDVSMANTDRLVRETSDMRNELESYIYDMRDKISSDAQLGPYTTDAEKDRFVSKNEAIETWLYEDGFDASKSVYAEKLAELKKLGNPIEIRQTEALGRAAAVGNLQSQLELYQNWVNSSQTEERYQHITDEERQTVRKVADDISAWMYDLMDKQGGLALNEDPVLTVAALNEKIKALNKACSPIMNKPAPIKKKEDPPKSAPAATEPMDVDSTNGADAGGSSTTPNGDAMPEAKAGDDKMEVE